MKITPKTEKVTKLDAARRQLRTAIRLFFEDADTISTYTLICAVQDLLRGLHQARGGEGSFIKDTDLIKEEHYKE